MKWKYIFMIFIFTLSLSSLPACKAKTCDGLNNVADEGSSRKKKKNMGLFSRQEKRRKRW